MTGENKRFKPLSEIKKRNQRWIWDGRIPRGVFMLIEGDPGLGKSYLLMWLAAIISVGGITPDGKKIKKGKVALFNYEDDLERTTKSRFEAMDHNAEYIFVHNLDDDDDLIFDSERGLQDIEALIIKEDIDLVIVDPLLDATPADVNPNNAQEVRQWLRGIANIARETDCTIIGVRHLAKSQYGNQLYRGGGSNAYLARVRLALRVEAHPNDPDKRLLLHLKGNLSAAAKSLEFRIVGTSNGNSSFEWIGMSDMTIHDIGMDDQKRKAPRPIDLAVEFIKEKLAEGPMRSAGLKALAKSEGIAERTFTRAIDVLGVTNFRKKPKGAKRPVTFLKLPKPQKD